MIFRCKLFKNKYKHNTTYARPYKQPNFIPQEIRKRIKTKFKVSREKEVIQIGVEISDVETRR